VLERLSSRLAAHERSSRRRRVIAAVVVAAVVVAASALVLPDARTTPAAIALAPATIPLASGHPLEVPRVGTTLLLDRSGTRTALTGSATTRPGRPGIWVAPQSSGAARIAVPTTTRRGKSTVVYVSAAGFGPVTTSVAVSGRGTERRELGTAEWSGLAQRYDVTPEARAGDVTLTISTRNNASEPALLATRIVSTVEPPVRWPSAAAVVVWSVVTIVGVLVVLVLAGIPVSVAAALVALLTAAAVLRLRELVDVAGSSLTPDATFYRYIADTMQHPYDSASREPLWPLIDRLWFAVVGSSDLNLRILTVVISTALVGVVYALAARATGNRLAGLAAAGLIAINGTLVRAAPQGLREELYSLLMVAVALVLVFTTTWSARTRVFTLAALVSSLALLRLTTLYFVPILLLIGLWRGLRIRHVVAITAISIAVLVPYLVYSQHRFGDALWASNIHGVYFRNFEFVLRDRSSCDGCPTLPEMLASASFAGKDISTSEYIFGMHPLRTVVADTARGFRELLLEPGALLRTLVGSEIAMIAYLVGIALAFVNARGRELILFVVLGVNMLAFLVPVGGFDLRLAYHVIPFMITIAVLPVAYALEVLRRHGWARRANRVARGQA
jgi:hypothetical protein